MGHRSILACIWLAACAPVTTTRKIVETPRDGGLARGAPQKGQAELRVAASSDGFTVSSFDNLVCSERRVTIVKRVERTHRSVNKPITVIEYLLGIGLGAAGGISIADPDTSLDVTGWGETPRNDLNRENMQKAGAGAAGLGAVFLTLGIVNTFRGGTSQRNLADESRFAETGNTVACGTSPRAGDDVALSIEDKVWPLGKTDKKGQLTVASSGLAADVFDRAWQKAVVTAGSASASVDLTAAREELAEREWTALLAAPALEAGRRFRARFRGVHEAEIKPMMLQLADRAHAPVVLAALGRGNAADAKQALVTWKQDAPDSSLAAANEAELAELERRGPADYLYAKYESAIADPAKLDEAEQRLASLLAVAPQDPRLPEAQKVTKKKRAKVTASQVKLAAAHAGRARSHARHGELAKAELELAAAMELAPEHPDVTRSVQYVEKFRAAAAARAQADQERAAAKAKAEQERTERARLAAEAKAVREAERAERRAKAKAAADAERARRAEEKAEAKLRREAERAERLAKAKAAADAERARRAEEKAKAEEARAIAAEEKAKAREEVRRAAAERARLAAEEKARAAEAAQARELARAERKRDAERARLERLEKEKAEAATRLEKTKAAEAVRIAAIEERRLSERARRGSADGAASRRSSPSFVGLWASTIAEDAIWLIDLRTDGSGRTAVWMSGHLVGFRAIDWKLEGGVLVLDAGASLLRSVANEHAGELVWGGVRWKRQ